MHAAAAELTRHACHSVIASVVDETLPNDCRQVHFSFRASTTKMLRLTTEMSRRRAFGTSGCAVCGAEPALREATGGNNPY